MFLINKSCKVFYLNAKLNYRSGLSYNVILGASFVFYKAILLFGNKRKQNSLNEKSKKEKKKRGPLPLDLTHLGQPSWPT